MALAVRTPVVADADALGHVHVRAWQAAYRNGLMPDAYLDALSPAERSAMWLQALGAAPSSRRARLVVEADGVVVGFALVGPADGDPASEVGELYAINVDPDHWGSGAGPRLIDAAVAALRSAGCARAVLWVHPDNARARRFYAARGWIDDHVERRQDVLGVEVPEARLSLQLG